jgi:ABC-type Na+ transport system ATPase subunit NatA
MIHVQNLVKTFGAFAAVDDVSFEARVDFLVLAVLACVLLVFGAHRFNKIEI